jgi:hypothetical protein
LAQVRSTLIPAQTVYRLRHRHSSIEGADRIFRRLDIFIKDFDWSLVLLEEDLLVHDWKDNATYMASRSLNPDKIAYGPQVKAVANQLSTLEGEARGAYVEQQRRMVQDTLDVSIPTPPFIT